MFNVCLTFPSQNYSLCENSNRLTILIGSGQRFTLLKSRYGGHLPKAAVCLIGTVNLPFCPHWARHHPVDFVVEAVALSKIHINWYFISTRDSTENLNTLLHKLHYTYLRSYWIILIHSLWPVNSKRFVLKYEIIWQFLSPLVLAVSSCFSFCLSFFSLLVSSKFLICPPSVSTTISIALALCRMLVFRRAFRRRRRRTTIDGGVDPAKDVSPVHEGNVDSTRVKVIPIPNIN